MRKHKDVHININIENNLLSKNKQIEPNTSNIVAQPKPAETPKTDSSGYHIYDPELPRAVNDFYGIMAAKMMHKLEGKKQPLNMQNALPQIPPTIASVSTTPPPPAPPPPAPPPPAPPLLASAPTHTSPVMSSVPPTMPPTPLHPPPTVHVPAHAPPVYAPPSPVHPDPVLAPVAEIQHAEDDPPSDAEVPEDVNPEVNAAEYAALPKPTDLDDPELGTVQITNGYPVLSPAQEELYMKTKLNPTQKGNRKRMIRDIMNIAKPLRVKKATIRDWALGDYVMTYRPEKWQEILEGTYAY